MIAHLRADAITWQGMEPFVTPFMESLGLSKYAQVLNFGARVR
jgi:hypothetical protein